MAAFTARSGIYDAPLALDSSLSRTHGLDPEFGMARNVKHVIESMEYILGPMPVQAFFEQYVPDDSSCTGERTRRLASRNAFKSVPSRGATAAEIYTPLVSSSLLSRISSLLIGRRLRP